MHACDAWQIYYMHATTIYVLSLRFGHEQQNSLRRMHMHLHLRAILVVAS